MASHTTGQDATAPTSDHVAVTDGTRLHVLRRALGAPGRPVVLVHGLASNARLWDGVAHRLAEAGHPSVAVDLRSHGRSGLASHGHSTAQAASDVLDVAEAHRFERPLVVGQSWGGNVVVEVATRRELVAGAVAVDGGAIDLPRAFDGDWEACRRALTPPRIAGTHRDTVEGWMRRNHPDFDDWAIEAQLANFDVRDDGTVAPHLPLEHHLAIVRSLWEAPASDALPRVAVPTLLLLVAGGHAPTAGGWLDRMVEGHPILRRVVVEDRVHDVHAQDPDLVARHVLAHLEEVD